MHVMVDIESLGTRPGSVVMQIGAARFNHRGVAGDPVLWHVDVSEQLMRGLTVCPDTMRWWAEQSDEARYSVFMPESVESMSVVLCEFQKLLSRELANERFHLWANPCWFDLAMIDKMYETLGKPYPWPRRQTMDVRTFYRVADLSKDDLPRPGVQHRASDDAAAQAQAVVIAAGRIGYDLS